MANNTHDAPALSALRGLVEILKPIIGGIDNRESCNDCGIYHYCHKPEVSMKSCEEVMDGVRDAIAAAERKEKSDG